LSAIANVTLTDSSSVNHTYTPVEAVPLAKWKDLSSGLHIGSPELSLGMRLPSRTAKTFKVSLKLVAPTLEVSGAGSDTGFQPAPTVAYNNIATVDLIMHERAGLEERQDLLALIRDALSDAVVTTAVTNFEKPF